MFLVLMLVRAQRVQLLRVRPSCYSLGAGVCAVFPAGAQLGMPFCLGRQEYSHRPGTFFDFCCLPLLCWQPFFGFGPV
jgi:hypothetical protein